MRHNRHSTRHTSRVSVGLQAAASAGVWLRATETVISAALWDLVAREGVLLLNWYPTCLDQSYAPGGK